MKKISIILAILSLSVISCFASEKIDVKTSYAIEGFTFADALSSSSDAQIIQLKDKSGKTEIESNGFFDWVSLHEKHMLIGAIASTASFGTFFLLGIIFMAAGWSTWMNPSAENGTRWGGLYVCYAGGVLFGLSWIFFLSAGAFWAFWGIAQWLKKNDYEATAFIRPISNDIENCKSTGCSVGMSISLF